MSDVDLEDALDGVLKAVRYCDNRELEDLSAILARCYQQIARSSPSADWGEVESVLRGIEDIHEGRTATKDELIEASKDG